MYYIYIYLKGVRNWNKHTTYLCLSNALLLIHRLPTCAICFCVKLLLSLYGNIVDFTLYDVYLWLHFTAKYDHIYNALWFPQDFYGIKLNLGSYYRFMRLNRYTEFSWFITMDSMILDYFRDFKETHDPVSISVKRLIVKSPELSKPWDFCLKFLDRSEIWHAHHQQCLTHTP